MQDGGIPMPGGAQRAGACSVRGGRHARGDTACQDASFVCCEEGRVFAAVADGHGSAAHVRSAVGAKWACQTAYDAMRSARLPELTEDSVRALAEDIVRRWEEAVTADARQHPFTPEELTAVPQDARQAYAIGRDIPRAYGTTLLAALADGGRCLVLRCGDGECVFLCEDGAYDCPVPENPACSGHVTVSLCEGDAGAFRWHMGKTPVGIFLTTDGLTNNALRREGLMQWYDRLLLACAGSGAEEMLRGVRRDLESVAAKGFGDDVSLAYMLDGNAASGLQETVRRRVLRCRRERAIAERKKRMAVLESDIRWAAMAIERRRAEYEQAEDPQMRARLLEGVRQAQDLLRESSAALERLMGESPRDTE